MSKEVKKEEVKKEYLIFDLLKENEVLSEKLKSNKQKIKELLQEENLKGEEEKVKNIFDIAEEEQKVGINNEQKNEIIPKKEELKNKKVSA